MLRKRTNPLWPNGVCPPLITKGRDKGIWDPQRKRRNTAQPIDLCLVIPLLIIRSLRINPRTFGGATAVKGPTAAVVITEAKTPNTIISIKATRGARKETIVATGAATNPAIPETEATGVQVIEVATTPGEATLNPAMITPLPLNSPTLNLPTRTEDLQVGGRLYYFRDKWTFCPWSHSVIKNGLGWAWVEKKKPPKVHRFFQEPTSFLLDYVQELLLKKVIEPVDSIYFQARLFCVDKKNSSRKRVILDLSRLNKRIRCDKFRMLTIAQIRTLLPAKAYACSVDLTDAYWHVPIARHLSPYLGFCLGRQAYVFRTMPFGLNIAPKVFTKTREGSDTGTQVAGYPGSCLSGRLANLGRVSRGVSLSDTDSDQIPSTSGISDKFQKVQPDASNEVYLAGSSLGSGEPLPLSTPGEETGDRQVGASFEKTKKHDTTTPRKSIGVPPICCHHRSNLEGQAQRYGASLVQKSEPVTPGPERTYAEVAIQTTLAMVENQEPIKVSSAEASTSYPYHPHGRLPKRMGRPL